MMASNGAASGHPGGTVASTHLDIAVAEPGETAHGRFGKARVTLDCIDLVRDPTQDGGGVARASPDLQDPVARPGLGSLDHQRDDICLRDRLPFGNREGAVLVGEFRETRRDEFFARHLAHRLQHARVAHAAAGDLTSHHPLTVRGKMVELNGRLGHGDVCVPIAGRGEHDAVARHRRSYASAIDGPQEGAEHHAQE